MTMSLLRFSSGTRSAWACSYQSTSPFCNAGRGGGIRDNLPLDPLKVGNLAAAGPFRRFPARHVAVELLPGGAAAWEKLVLEESIWTGAHDFIDCFEGIGLRKPLRHDERVLHGNRVDQQREGPLQTNLHGLIVGHAPFINRFCNRLAERIPHRPGSEARCTVLRAHGFAVVPPQPFT